MYMKHVTEETKTAEDEIIKSVCSDEAGVSF